MDNRITERIKPQDSNLVIRNEQLRQMLNPPNAQYYSLLLETGLGINDDNL